MIGKIKEIYEFGPFRLEVGGRRLLRGGEPLPVRGKVFDTLCVLVENGDNLVTKEELIKRVWPDSVVEENNLTQNISILRKVLGETPEGRDHIETVPRQGYRFAVPVRQIKQEVSSNLSAPEAGGELETSPSGKKLHALEQNVRFCTTDDNVRIAYATVGQGPPLVKAANWLNHLEFDWQSPVWRHVFRELARDHLLIRYDERGNGLSDWEVDDISFEAFVRDFEAVIKAAAPDRFSILGISQGASVAIDYTVRHPERVTHLILYGGYAKGWRKRDAQNIKRREALSTLMEHGWGEKSPAFHQVFTSLFLPEANAEQAQAWNDLQRICTSPRNAVRIWNATSQIDVRPLLPRVSVPTLVLHSRGEFAVPFEESREMAATIPGARLVALESRNHLVLEQEPAWSRFMDEVRKFLKT